MWGRETGTHLQRGSVVLLRKVHWEDHTEAQARYRSLGIWQRERAVNVELG